MTHPPRIVRILQQGGTKYFPLSAITYRACSTAAQTSAADDQTLALSDGRLEIQEAKFDISNEDTISLGDLAEAYNVLPEMIRQHLRVNESTIGGPVASEWADAWTHHYNHISTRSDFRTNARVYVLYDKAIRERWFSSSPSFNPSFFQEDIFKALMTQVQNSKIDRMLALQTGRDRGRSPSRNPLPRPPPRDRSPSRLPPIHGKSRPEERPFRAPEPGPRAARCFLCGSWSHIGTQCTETPVFMVKNGKGWSHNGRLFCWIFNLPSGCSKVRCSFTHNCTLCGGSHSAQSCTR